MRLVPLLLLAACSDYGLSKDDSDPGNPDADTDPVVVDTHDTADTDVPIEDCNGADDDGDGAIDEDFPDVDADGIADCVDTCAVAAAVGADVPQTAACLPGFTPPADPGDLVVEWNWTGLSTNPAADAVLQTPVVGNLTDDDGDGVIDDDDVPDVAFVTCEWIPDPDGFPSCAPADLMINYDGTLVILDGATGEPHLELDGFSVLGPIALADVDADGVPEVLALDSEEWGVGVHADGTESFRTGTRTTSSAWSDCLNVADLDEDGVAEVVTHGATWDGLTGKVEAYTLDWNTEYGMARSCPVSDIDNDGDQEWFPGSGIGGPKGKETDFDAAPFSNSRDSQWTIPVQGDGDADAELAWFGHGTYTLFDTDGSVIRATPIEADPMLTAGPPCVADFDGDGAPEIGLPWGKTLRVLEMDGTEVWSMPIADSTGAAGCSGFDADGDGAVELFYGDQYDVWMLDGATGAPWWQDSDHRSGTGYEYPTIADIDADGSAEVLVANNNDLESVGWEGLVAYGHADGQWAPAGPTWNAHDYAVTNIGPDLSVPVAPTPAWRGPQVWRARPAGDPTPDLAIAVTDVCVASCDPAGPVELAIQVRNHGHADTTVPVALYRVDGGTPILLQTTTVTVPAGRSADGTVFELVHDDVGSDGFLVRVDDDGTGAGTVDECDETDDEASWDADPCP